jgi:glycosyltransferase involved in cell wall biosynthesis
MEDKKKQIVFYAPYIYPCKTGGMEIFNYNLVNSIRKEYPNINISVLTRCKSYTNINPKAIIIRSRYFLVTRYGLGTLSAFINLIIFKKIKLNSVRCIVISYTSNFEYNAYTFLFIRFIFKVPYVIHIHGGGLKPWKTPKMQKIFFKNAKKVAGVSRPIIHEYEKRTGRKIEFIPPLLPFSKNKKDKKSLLIENNLDKYNKIILFVGSMKPLKGPIILVKAFMEIDRGILEKEKVGLVMVGDGPLKEQLANMIINNCMEKYISLVGEIPNEMIADYYALADIFVIPSLFEGMPIALLEAMFHGLLCIGANVPGIKEIIVNNKNGVLFDKNNYLALSKALRIYISNDNSQKRLGIEASNFYKHNFNYSLYLEKMIKFIME